MDTNEDVKPPVEATSASTAADATATDVKTPAATTSVVEKTAEKPSDEQFAQAILDRHEAAEKADTAEEADPKNEKQEATPVDKSTEEKEDPKVESKPDEQPIPYHRFKEVNEQLTSAKPLAEKQQRLEDYCRTNEISEDDFQGALDFLKELKTNPAAARERLVPIMQTLDGFVGKALPTDLAKEVEEGAISQERAEEIARYRNGTKFSEQRQQQTQQQQVETAQKAMVSELGKWTMAKQSADPDFKAKTDTNAPDGKYELVEAKFLSLFTSNRGQVKTVADAVALAERAYAEVNGYATRLAPKPRSAKVLTTTRSSVQTGNRGNGPNSALEAALAKNGLPTEIALTPA